MISFQATQAKITAAKARQNVAEHYVPVIRQAAEIGLNWVRVDELIDDYAVEALQEAGYEVFVDTEYSTIDWS